MNKDTLFKIIAMVVLIALLVLLTLYYFEIKDNPCKESSCSELFQHISDKECYKYSYPYEDIIKTENAKLL